VIGKERENVIEKRKGKKKKILPGWGRIREEKDNISLPCSTTFDLYDLREVCVGYCEYGRKSVGESEL